MSTGNPQRQRRLITRLKNIKKFFIKNSKRDFGWVGIARDCNYIIQDEIANLKRMKNGRKKK